MKIYQLLSLVLGGKRKIPGCLLVLLGMGCAANVFAVCNVYERDYLNGYVHENWSQDTGGASPGNYCVEPNTSGGGFTASWNNVHNYLGRRGLGFDDMAMSHQGLGWFIADYQVEYAPNCVSGDNSYMGVYGWSLARKNDPSSVWYNSDPALNKAGDLVEWYILERWCQWNPTMQDGAQDLGTIQVDGIPYRVVVARKPNNPSIRSNYDDGSTENDNDQFWQFFSIRENSETSGGSFSGTVNITGHFVEWEKLRFDSNGNGQPDRAMMLANLNEVTMLVEGYGGSNSASGTATFNTLNVEADTRYIFDGYHNYPGGGAQLLVRGFAVPGGPWPSTSVDVSGSNASSVTVSGDGATRWYITPNNGVSSVTVQANLRVNGVLQDTINVTVGSSVASQVSYYETRAIGTQGFELLMVNLNGVPQAAHTMTTDFQVYSGELIGEGVVSVEFINDDGEENGRDVRVDYLTVNGERRETENMNYNSGTYANGSCGGGGNSEWLHCSGSVDFGYVESAHTITIRARGNQGGEHINLLIDGEPANAGWWLGTNFQEYSAQVSGDGDINVEFDNDGGQKDVIVDWIKVDTQSPRQAENMQYNTGAYANNRCGGGQYTEWMHCNGRIGFGKISDNFD